MSSFNLVSILNQANDEAEPAYTPPPIDTSYDAQLVAILDGPPRPGEPVHIRSARKEHELRIAFGALPPMVARAMFHRLAEPQQRDALAARFARLNVERRVRLLAFLVDARRRLAQVEAALAWRR
jgi:hypothetical protein